jgi:hypothetical protein
MFLFCNVYINVNLFNGRKLTMSVGAHAEDNNKDIK